MISFIYFDVGGVAVLDFSKSHKLQDLKNELGSNFPEHYSFLEGFVKRFEQNPHIWPLIEGLRSQYTQELDLILEGLSNTH